MVEIWRVVAKMARSGLHEPTAKLLSPRRNARRSAKEILRPGFTVSSPLRETAKIHSAYRKTLRPRRWPWPMSRAAFKHRQCLWL
jgi:hypothetical protein